jgi:hypothetical protein
MGREAVGEACVAFVLGEELRHDVARCCEDAGLKRACYYGRVHL